MTRIDDLEGEMVNIEEASTEQLAEMKTRYEAAIALPAVEYERNYGPCPRAMLENDLLLIEEQIEDNESQDYTVALTINVRGRTPQHAAEKFGEYLSSMKRFNVIVVRDDQEIGDGVECETRIYG